MDERVASAVKQMTSMPLFPFEGDLRLKELGPPMESEMVREGEGDRPCQSCGADERVWWNNERWKVTSLRPTVDPVGLFIETIDHIDFEDFDDQLGAEFGLLTMHLEASINTLESVGRVHIHRYGDGSSHFHVWFLGRPARQLELYGWGNAIWTQLLPPLPTEEIDANHAHVVAELVKRFGGTVADRT